MPECSKTPVNRWWARPYLKAKEHGNSSKKCSTVGQPSKLSQVKLYHGIPYQTLKCGAAIVTLPHPPSSIFDITALCRLLRMNVFTSFHSQLLIFVRLRLIPFTKCANCINNYARLQQHPTWSFFGSFIQQQAMPQWDFRIVCCKHFFFWDFCPTSTKRYLITSQTRVKGVRRPDTPPDQLLRMVRWCIRLTRLTLLCGVIRYRLVQFRQKSHKRSFRVGGPQSPFSLSLPLSFSFSSFFLSFAKRNRKHILWIAHLHHLHTSSDEFKRTVRKEKVLVLSSKCSYFPFLSALIW